MIFHCIHYATCLPEKQFCDKKILCFFPPLKKKISAWCSYQLKYPASTGACQRRTILLPGGWPSVLEGINHFVSPKKMEIHLLPQKTTWHNNVWWGFFTPDKTGAVEKRHSPFLIMRRLFFQNFSFNVFNGRQDDCKNNEWIILKFTYIHINHSCTT